MVNLAERPSFVDATEKFVGDFTGNKPTETLDLIAAELGSREEAIAAIVFVTADGFIKAAETRGERAQMLTDWHSLLKSWCTDEYRMLEEAHPTASRADLNKDLRLETLNGIRRGVRRAMVREQAGIAAMKRRQPQATWELPAEDFV